MDRTVSQFSIICESTVVSLRLTVLYRYHDGRIRGLCALCDEEGLFTVRKSISQLFLNGCEHYLTLIDNLRTSQSMLNATC